MPDSSWPAAPIGWVWWQTQTRSLRQKISLGLVVGVPSLVVAGLIGGEIYGAAIGCGSVDPTDPRNYSTVTILNDTARPVIVADCPGAYCNPEELPRTLAPGQSHVDHAGCHSTGMPRFQGIPGQP